MTKPDRAIPDAAFDDRLAIVGTAGTGKTYAAKGLVERVVRTGARICIVDPLGVWYGLRSGPDGTPAGGLPLLIFGGAHGDLPIAETDGDKVGRLVGTTAIQCVLDLSGLGSKAARIRFMRAFAEAVYEANAEPLHLVLDEADLWSPQRPQPDQTVLQNRIGEIVRRGRVRGFIPWLITQRPAVLDKDVLSQADILIAMSLTSSQDRAAIGAWIEGQGDRAQQQALLSALPSLPRGTGYVWAPRHGILERVAFPPIGTFDSSRTPSRGERRTASTLLPVDIAVARAALANAAPDAPAEATLQAAHQRGRQAGRQEAQAGLQALTEEVAALRAAIATAAAALSGAGPATIKVTRPVEQAAPAPAARRVAKAAMAGPPREADVALHGAARAMLVVLVQAGEESRTWQQVATLAGLAPRGGYWNAGLKQLRDLGYFLQMGDRVFSTTAGRMAIGPQVGPPTTPAERLALWCAKLPSPAPDMLRHLVAAATTVSREQLAERLGKKAHGGHWNAGVKALRDNGLVTVGRAGIAAVRELIDG